MMKRYIYILAIAGIALLSCDKQEGAGKGGDIQPAGQPILIGPSVVNNTKAMVEQVSDMYGEKLSLYGWTFLDSEHPGLPSFVMNNVFLNHQEGVWSYSPLQYWMSNTSHYGFAGIWPGIEARNDRRYEPTPFITGSADWRDNSSPFDDFYVADDVERNVIAAVAPSDAYLTNIVLDAMGGYVDVPSSHYGEPVDLPMEHFCCAFRFRVRNLTEKPICLHNWYMTGLKTHSDMAAIIIGGLQDGTHTTVLHRVCDGRFVSLKHANVESVGVKDTAKIKPILSDGTLGAAEEVICADPSTGDNNYKYIVISQKLPEISVDETARDAEIAAVKAKYAAKYPHYSEQIYWGPERGMGERNYYLPIVYERGSILPDYNNDGIRGNKGDYDLNVHVYECRSHMVRCDNNGNPSPSGERYYPNGGIYMPVSASNEANLYSPYFMSSESHTTPIEDWKEGMGVSIASRTPSHTNADGSISVFRWTANDGKNTLSEGDANFNNYRWPATDITEAIGHSEDDDDVFPLSVRGGDLANALRKDGYVMMFPQDVTNLVFHLMTASKVTSGDTEYDYYSAPIERIINVADFTADKEWKPGYKYDYLITVTSDKILITLDVEPWKERHATLE